MKRAALPVAVVVALLLVWRLAFAPPSDAVVVYCAVDAVHAKALLERFERETGIPLAIHFDTEATKSLGLIERLTRERAAPRADVFWNNELLGMAQLARDGLLQPYKGPGWQRIPAAYKDADGRWAGLGARLRVWIHRDGADWEPLAAAVERGAGDLSRATVAKPLYGTTLTHYAALWQARGAEGLKRWHAEARAAGLREVGGNAQTRDLVVAGGADLGWTDTDDAFGAIDGGAKVAMQPVELDGRTIAIPNTVGLIRDRPRARRLVDWLLSAEAELALARSSSRQVPLGPLSASQEQALPAEVARLRPAVERGMPLAGLLDARRECLAWLKEQYR